MLLVNRLVDAADDALLTVGKCLSDEVADGVLVLLDETLNVIRDLACIVNHDELFST